MAFVKLEIEQRFSAQLPFGGTEAREFPAYFFEFFAFFYLNEAL